MYIDIQVRAICERIMLDILVNVNIPSSKIPVNLCCFPINK